MYTRLLTLLCGVLLLLPVMARADAGGDSDTATSQKVDTQQVTADYNTGYQQLKADD